jgi:2-keto-4-pentenoate hydratase
MDEFALRSASDLLLQHWQAGTTLTDLPTSCRPSSRAEGYAVQARHMRQSSQALYGWKIAATSQAGQNHIAVDGPLAGRLLAEQVRPMDSSISLAGNHMRVAELEFAFRMGQTLPPREQGYSKAEVMAAVASLHAAIELPDSRFTDYTKVGADQLIADNACAHLFMLGAGHAEGWQDIDLSAFVVTGWHCQIEPQPPGPQVPVHGVGANVLGDPCLALTWLANELSEQGAALEEGQVVTTGTCVTPIAIRPGMEVFGNFGCFGMVSARFY